MVIRIVKFVRILHGFLTGVLLAQGNYWAAGVGVSAVLALCVCEALLETVERTK